MMKSFNEILHLLILFTKSIKLLVVLFIIKLYALNNTIKIFNQIFTSILDQNATKNKKRIRQNHKLHMNKTLRNVVT